MHYYSLSFFLLFAFMEPAEDSWLILYPRELLEAGINN